MDNLYYYQKEATEQIIKFYNSEVKNAKMIISAGLGVSQIIVNVIEKIIAENKKCRILLLCSYKSEVKQYFEKLMSSSTPLNVCNFISDIRDEGIFVDTYQTVLTEDYSINYNHFDFIICNNLDFLSEDYIYPFFSNSYNGKRLTIMSSEKENKLIKNDKLIFKYNISDAIKDGRFSRISEIQFVQDYFLEFLTNIGFDKIECEKAHKNFRTDVEAVYNKNHYIFEVKTYRTEHVSANLIENAAYVFSGMLKNVKIKNINPVMVVTCKVDELLKEEIFNETQIEIWDISNLLYLCKDSQSLIQKLSSNVSFPISNIKTEKTIFTRTETIVNEPKYKSQYQKFEDLFNKCKPGKDDEKEYEEICTQAIKYLFETEFFQMSNQHKTGDNLFRMDLICSLKGTTEFWKFLMQFYNTKFLVFEYKNYVEKISQNLVFITSKYLYPSALRNVAFIISRNGLDKNADTVINSKIKNDKTLIISLTDKDLLIMIALKDEGKEPSDYLLEKVENLLMSLSM